METPVQQWKNSVIFFRTYIKSEDAHSQIVRGSGAAVRIDEDHALHTARRAGPSLRFFERPFCPPSGETEGAPRH